MAINNPLRCLLFINTPRNGWSETWPLRATEWRRALLDAARLAQARSFILAQNCVIEWACVHLVIEPWTEQVVITDRLEAQPVWGPTDHDGSGLLWRFETAQGKWSNHLFRAIDDFEIHDTRWLRDPFLLPAATPVLPTPLSLATDVQFLTYAFTTFRELTAFHERLPDSDEGLPLWNILPWENVFFRHVSYRGPGRRYRRVSWEPGNYPESPWFSPCGEAVSVLRSCYSGPARFGPAEPPREIRYYFASPHVSVLPLPTVFWGRARDRTISNTDGVGEITGPGSRHYQHGDEIGSAPGDHHSGTAADFLGQAAAPWSGGGETPEEFRPACDEPPAVRVLQMAGTHGTPIVDWVTLEITPMTLVPAGALSSEAVGEPALELNPVTVEPHGVPSEEVVGEPALIAGSPSVCSWLRQHKGILSPSTGSFQSVAFDLPVLAGNQVVVMCLTKGITVGVSVTDSQGNTYTPIGGAAYNVPGGYLLVTTHTAIASSNGTLTITATDLGGPGPPQISLVAFESDSSVGFNATGFNAANSNSPQAGDGGTRRITGFIMNSSIATTITVPSPWVLVEELFGGSGPFAIGVAVNCSGSPNSEVFTVDDTNEWSQQSIGQ